MKMMTMTTTMNDQTAGRTGRTEGFGKWNCAKIASLAGTETHAPALGRPAQPGTSRIGRDGHRTARTLSGNPPLPWGSLRPCVGCAERKTPRSRLARSRMNGPILGAEDRWGYRANGDGGQVRRAT